MQFDINLRIDVSQAISRRLQLAPTDVLCSVKNLALEIGKIDIVKIDNSNRPDPGCGKIQRSRRTKSAGTDA